jgi:radical SAM protein with 4Fe4S-binding SPASM domain
MSYFLTRRAVLKWLETPSLYHIAKDELYELDDESFHFLKSCASRNGCSTKGGPFIDYCIEEGLLTTEKVVVPRPVVERAPSPSLRYLELQITDACNLACKHCYIDGKQHHELSVDQVNAVLREFQDMQGLRVLITGGEPLVHRMFDEINAMLPDFFLRKVLFTNGTLLKKDIIATLKFDEIQVSIDGMEAAHDYVRGAGTFKRSLEAVRHAIDLGFDVSISTMIHRRNISDFDSMEHLFKSIGIKDWTVDVPVAVGRLEGNSYLSVSPDEGGKYLVYGYGGGLHSSSEGFGCGLHLMSVMADEKIAKCTFYHNKAVGTLDRGLRAAWMKIRPIRLSELSCDCGYREICRGGCRYRAEVLEGKGGKDFYRCMLYGIL